MRGWGAFFSFHTPIWIIHPQVLAFKREIVSLYMTVSNCKTSSLNTKQNQTSPISSPPENEVRTRLFLRLVSTSVAAVSSLQVGFAIEVCLCFMNGILLLQVLNNSFFLPSQPPCSFLFFTILISHFGSLSADGDPIHLCTHLYSRRG